MKHINNLFFAKRKEFFNFLRTSLLLVMIVSLSGCNSDLGRYVDIYNKNSSDFTEIIEIMEKYPEMQEIRAIDKYSIKDDPTYLVINGLEILKYDFRNGEYINIDNNRATAFANAIRKYFDQYNIKVIYNFAADDNIRIKQQKGYGWIYMKNGNTPDKESLSIARMVKINSRWYAIITG